MIKTITETKYGILNLKTEELVTYYTSSNAGGEFCGDTQYLLSHDDDNIWLVPSEETAQKALVTDTAWYNAGYETPTHSCKISPTNYCVVKVEITSVISKAQQM